MSHTKFIPKLNFALGLAYLSMNIFQSRAIYYSSDLWANNRLKFNMAFGLYFILTLWKTLSSSQNELVKLMQSDQIFSRKIIKFCVYSKKFIWFSMGVSSLISISKAFFG